MERIKRPKIVFSFATTTAAMAMECACGSEMGRLIPLPAEISGGCGLAWCSDPEMEGKLTALMAQNNIIFEQKKIIELY